MGAARSLPRDSLLARAGRHPRLSAVPVGPAAPDLSDPRSFASAYRAHGPGVYAAAYRVLRRASEAEDVAQEVFLRLWSDPDRFDPRRGELGSYLRMMARSRALDVCRSGAAADRARDRLKLVEGAADATAEQRPADLAARAEDHATVREALRTLPERQREAVVLTYWGGLGAGELATRSAVPFGTARSRVRLGLERLRAACHGRLNAGEG